MADGWQRRFIDYAWFDRVEGTLEGLILEVDQAEVEGRIDGQGPDRPEDVVAMLVSTEFKNHLQMPFYGEHAPLWSSVDFLPVPLVEFPPLKEAYAPLERKDAESLFEEVNDPSPGHRFKPRQARS